MPVDHDLPKENSISFALPNPLINSVKTPGSLSIKHQSPALDIAETQGKE